MPSSFVSIKRWKIAFLVVGRIRPLSYARPVQRQTRWCLAGVLFVLAGCGGAPPPAPKAPAAASKRATKAAGPATPRDRLIAVLHTVKSEGPVLGALDARARADLHALMRQVTPAEQSQITRSGSPFAVERPLLFLGLGGDSPDAYYALATTGRGADELVGMRRRSGKSDMDDLVQVAADVSLRAAELWLRNRAVDVASRRALTPGLCDRIDAVAGTLNRLDIRRRAREMAQKLAPSAARELRVARAAAWQLDVPAARAALARARALGADSDSAKAVEHVVDEAALVQRVKGEKPGIDASVKAARALLDLHHAGQIDALVAPYRAQAGSHLGLASVLALAASGNGMCMGVPAGAGNARLCAAAWHDSKKIANAVALLDSAWQSGRGRDDPAIETWLGMGYVLPWVYETIRDAGIDPSTAKQHFKARLAATQNAVKEAAAASHTFDGLVLFVDASAAGLEASKRQKAGKRVHLQKAVREELERRATELGRRSPRQPFTQAAVLAVAGMLSQEQDIGPLLGLLPDPVAPGYRRVRAVLEAWNAAAHGAAGAAKGRSLLAGLIPDTPPRSLERAKTVLLMAELDAALTHAPHAYNVLSQIAAQLTNGQTPAALRLQAGIDHAGALSRASRRADAEKVLSTLLQPGIPKGTGDDHDLALLAKAYLVVLRARAATGNERKQYIDRLSHVFDGEGHVSSRIRLWRDLWQRELVYQSKKRRCGGLKSCLARAEKERSVPQAELEAAMGPEALRILHSGTLTIGSLDIQFNFSRQAGLVPQVEFKPRLLAAELPGTR